MCRHVCRKGFHWWLFNFVKHDFLNFLEHYMRLCMKTINLYQNHEKDENLFHPVQSWGRLNKMENGNATWKDQISLNITIVHHFITGDILKSENMQRPEMSVRFLFSWPSTFAEDPLSFSLHDRPLFEKRIVHFRSLFNFRLCDR